MTYMCFISSDEGMRPVGIIPDKDTAMGRLILEMTNDLTDAVPDDAKEDPRITFGAWDYAFGSDPGAGFKVEGTMYGPAYRQEVGYALKVDEKEET